MSYWVTLNDPITNDVISLEENHFMRGGTYCVGGTKALELNITYNYGKHYYRTMGKDGLWMLSGKTAAETMPIIKKAMSLLKDDVVPDYWFGSEGNAKRALAQLYAMATMRPDGVWQVD